MSTILHITQRLLWSAAQQLGKYRGDTLDSEGFIHCSTLVQLVGSANRFFKNQQDVVILVIDSDRVQAEIRYEGAEVNNLFPHIYGELNIEAVVQAIDWHPRPDGLFALPPELSEQRNV